MRLPSLLQSARQGEPLAAAARRMVDAKVHRLVVLDDDGHARGIDENARRLLLTKEGQVTDILVSLDFARAFAEA